jgi:hypothetical protein
LEITVIFIWCIAKVSLSKYFWSLREDDLMKNIMIIISVIFTNLGMKSLADRFSRFTINSRESSVDKGDVGNGQR